MNFKFSYADEIPNFRVSIGLSKSDSNSVFEYYEKWLKAVDTNITIINLSNYKNREMKGVFSGIDGLIITDRPVIAGIDTNEVRENDKKLDSFEIKLIDYARRKDMPILAINNAALLLNSHLGGINEEIDYSRRRNNIIFHQIENRDTAHNVVIEDNTILKLISSKKKGNVYSNHSKNISKLSDKLMPLAYSPDKVIEAYGIQEDSMFPFLLGIMWNPERMKYSNPFSKDIAKGFIDKVRYYHNILFPYEYLEQKYAVGEDGNRGFSYLWALLLLLLLGSVSNKSE